MVNITTDFFVFSLSQLPSTETWLYHTVETITTT